MALTHNGSRKRRRCTLSIAERAVELAHPRWHLWHSDEGALWATTTACALGGCGTTLSAADAGEMDSEISEWEHQRAGVAA